MSKGKAFRVVAQFVPLDGDVTTEETRAKFCTGTDYCCRFLSTRIIPQPTTSYCRADPSSERKLKRKGYPLRLPGCTGGWDSRLRDWKSTAASPMQESEVKAAIVRADLADDTIADLRRHHSEEMDSLRVDFAVVRARAEKAEAEVDRLRHRHPTLDAPPPTEPGYYWARMMCGTGSPVLVQVIRQVHWYWSTKACLYVLICGKHVPYIVANFDLWSTRIPEPKPEVKP